MSLIVERQFLILIVKGVSNMIEVMVLLFCSKNSGYFTKLMSV